MVDAVPGGALHVGSVPNMNVEAIRAYNAQQPTYYKLHKSDCRKEKSAPARRPRALRKSPQLAS
eukprot:1161108-Pelagomonas_calceolata.AAC.11